MVEFVMWFLNLVEKGITLFFLCSESLGKSALIINVCNYLHLCR